VTAIVSVDGGGNIAAEVGWEADDEGLSEDEDEDVTPHLGMISSAAARLQHVSERIEEADARKTKRLRSIDYLPNPRKRQWIRCVKSGQRCLMAAAKFLERNTCTKYTSQSSEVRSFYSSCK